MIYEVAPSPPYERTLEFAFVYDVKKQFPSYPEPYILCQKWVNPSTPKSFFWVKVPVTDGY